MKCLVYKFFIVLSYLVSFQSAHAQLTCLDVFSVSGSRDSHMAEQLSHEVAYAAEKVLDSTHIKNRSAKGYAILVGAMVGSAALTTFLGSRLPPELQFTSIFLAQVSTLGVYVLGAPIWEPMSSRFRQWAFGVGKNNQSHQSPLQLESTWIRTQENYSLNSQMSRNVISQFLLTVKDNFYAAYKAHKESDPVYSADQVAEAAYRMRILFKEVHPKDPSVRAVIQTTFTHHIKIESDYVDLVWQRLVQLDPQIKDPAINSYYRATLESWLNLSNSN